MLENILQAGEAVEFSEDAVYCGDGAVAAVNNGQIFLTDKRLIVCKKATSQMAVIIAVVVFAILFLGQTIITHRMGGMIQGAIYGAISIGVGNAIARFFKKEGKLGKAAYLFERQDIASVEDGRRGVRSMLVVTTKSGELCKIGVKDHEKWRSVLMK